jgi:hypothetical protein
MIKDIPELKVEDLIVAIAPTDSVEDEIWTVYMINLKDDSIKNVIAVSKGYGEIDGEKKATSTLRYFFEEVPALEVQPIESIQKSLFNITNEYMISYSHGGQLYDKKFIFVPGSIDAINFTKIPFVDHHGVMIR